MAAPDRLIGVTAREAGLARCRACGTLQRVAAPAVAVRARGANDGRARRGASPPEGTRCRACGARVHARIPRSLQRTWAFLLVGMMAYVPANLLPMMSTRSYEGNTSDTILSGVILLADQGSPGVAAIVFFASVCIPLAKFVVIAAIALSVQRRWPMSEHVRHRLHRVTELIGRWSMIDVFVVAVLAALIQLGSILTIQPGPGINAFALSVVFTMFAALSLDARLIWDVAPSGPLSAGAIADADDAAPSFRGTRARAR